MLDKGGTLSMLSLSETNRHEEKLNVSQEYSMRAYHTVMDW